MATHPPTTPTESDAGDQTSSNSSRSTTSATLAANALPSTAAYPRLKPSGRMLPPPSLLPSTSAHTPQLCPANTGTDNSRTTSSPPSAAGTTHPASAPSPRKRKLQSQISTLQTQISTAQTTLDETLAKLQHRLPTATETPPAPPDQPALQSQAEAIVKRHIRLLHAYNEIKDVGQELMGLIADARGVRLKEVMEEMGVGEKD